MSEAVVEPPVFDRLDWSVNGLSQAFAHLSARQVLSPAQRIALIVGGAGSVVGFVLVPTVTAIAFMVFTTAAYLAVLVFRINLLVRGRGDRHRFVVSDEAALALTDDELPVISILVPAYREPEIVHKLVDHLLKLDYPTWKLDVRLLLEEDDDETVNAATALPLPAHVTVVLVPAADPRTKPKALNYGVLGAKGEIITIYDAEDDPDPLQLRRVIAAFQQCGPEVACIQAELAYFNADENIITRWFAIEYRMWFTQYLPGLAATDAPIPLGGTSNHFRRDVLVAMGAWDPWNVTEDADLGIRLYRQGFRVRLVASTTLEEANVDFVNWVKQRSRWYKGYLQTWLVHLRRPRQLRRELGTRAFLRFNLFVGGTPLLALVNPIFWFLLLVWFALEPQFIKDVMPTYVYYPSLVCWVVGNFAFYYLHVVTAFQFSQRKVFTAALLTPVYWVMMSLAAAKAMVQMIVSPTFWEKTTHGLSRVTADGHDDHSPGGEIEPGHAVVETGGAR